MITQDKAKAFQAFANALRVATIAGDNDEAYQILDIIAAAANMELDPGGGEEAENLRDAYENLPGEMEEVKDGIRVFVDLFDDEDDEEI